jgi:hypothetical protein
MTKSDEVPGLSEGCLPWRCRSRTASLTGMKAWCEQSPHLICGLPQTPRTHSLWHARA